jgi:hypothetical protein
LAVLATLFLPKFFAQPESAALAEANRMLGALVRAQDTEMQLGSRTTGYDVTVAGGGGQGAVVVPCNAACIQTWKDIGMEPPTGARYAYACTPTSCTATRTVAGLKSVITLNYTATPKTYGCTGAYTLGTDTSRGCIKL